MASKPDATTYDDVDEFKMGNVTILIGSSIKTTRTHI